MSVAAQLKPASRHYDGLANVEESRPRLDRLDQIASSKAKAFAIAADCAGACDAWMPRSATRLSI